MPDRADDSGSVPTQRPVTLPGEDRKPAPPRSSRSVHAAGLVLTSDFVRGTDQVRVVGELTAATAPLLDAETVEVCRTSAGVDFDLLLDLTDVTFLDMMGVAALRRVHYRTLLLGRLRLGLPVAPGPGRMLSLAVDCGWLSPLFGPTTPEL